ncbi:MAG: N-acetylglucosamine kinase [Bryobacteraceae bacterium]
MFFLGVDGGQSSTMALIGDESGQVLGVGRGGPCNHVKASEGRSKFTSALRGCLQAACEQAGLDAASVRFASASLGFSGGPADKEAILREILHADKISVSHDALIALVGATAGEPGVVTIAGTGSIAFGRNGGGKTARAGGWGYIFGDEGGGFDLTRQALRAALRWEEGWGEPTSLHALLLDATGAASADDLMHRFYTADFSRPDIAALSKFVDMAAGYGDKVATGILHEAAQRLALIAAAVRRQLFAADEPARISYIGGVFRSALLMERFRSLIEMDEMNRFGPPAYGPAAGALLEAYRIAGISAVLSGVPPEKE